MIYRNYPRYLCLVGSVVILIEAIIQLVKINLIGLLALGITLLIFVMLDMLDFSNLVIPYEGTTMVILGIVAMVSRSYFGGALVIFAGIVWFAKENKKKLE